jgi:hypothetical protein
MDIEDKQLLNKCVDIRMNLIETMTAKGMPEDNEDRNVLLAALSGIERVAISRARIKSEEDISKSNGELQKLIAQVLVKVPNAVSNYNGEPLMLEDATIETVEGETSTGVYNISLDGFE